MAVLHVPFQAKRDRASVTEANPLNGLVSCPQRSVATSANQADYSMFFTYFRTGLVKYFYHQVIHSQAPPLPDRVGPQILKLWKRIRMDLPKLDTSPQIAVATAKTSREIPYGADPGELQS